MAKRPKKQWQIDVRSKLELMGIGYYELSEQIGLNEGTVRQVMCKDNSPGVKLKICSYLNIQVEQEEQNGRNSI